MAQQVVSHLHKLAHNLGRMVSDQDQPRKRPPAGGRAAAMREILHTCTWSCLATDGAPGCPSEDTGRGCMPASSSKTDAGACPPPLHIPCTQRPSPRSAAQVVFTIHQPNSDISDMFDDLLLLAPGAWRVALVTGVTGQLCRATSDGKGGRAGGEGCQRWCILAAVRAADGDEVTTVFVVACRRSDGVRRSLVGRARTLCFAGV